MNYQPVITMGDEMRRLDGTRTIRDHYRDFHRCWRVLSRYVDKVHRFPGTGLAESAQAIFAPETIEGYWWRRLSGQRSCPYIIPVRVRLMFCRRRIKRPA